MHLSESCPFFDLRIFILYQAPHSLHAVTLQFDRIENVKGKEEHYGYKHFLLFPWCFPEASLPKVLRGGIVQEWIKGYELNVDAF